MFFVCLTQTSVPHKCREKLESFAQKTKTNKQKTKPPLQTQAMPLFDPRPFFFRYLGLADSEGGKKLVAGRMWLFEVTV